MSVEEGSAGDQREEEEAEARGQEEVASSENRCGSADGQNEESGEVRGVDTLLDSPGEQDQADARDDADGMREGMDEEGDEAFEHLGVGARCGRDAGDDKQDAGDHDAGGQDTGNDGGSQLGREFPDPREGFSLLKSFDHAQGANGHENGQQEVDDPPGE